MKSKAFRKSLQSVNSAAKNALMGTQRLLVQDLPMGLMLAPWAAASVPKYASRGLSALVGTPSLNYDASKASGYDAMQAMTDNAIARIRKTYNVPEPKAFSPEYFSELAGSFAIPAGPVTNLMSKLGKAGKVVGPMADMVVAPYTPLGKSALAAMYMAPDALDVAMRNKQ